MVRRSSAPAGWFGAATLLVALSAAAGVGCKTAGAKKVEKKPAHELARAEGAPHEAEPAAEKVAEKEAETATGKPEGSIQAVDAKQLNVEASTLSATRKPKDGKSSVWLDTSSGKLPEDWPSEVPIYPGAKISMSMRLGRGYTLSLETGDSVAQVTAFYKAKLSQLQQEKAADLGKNQTLVWSDDKLPLQVTLALHTVEASQPTRATLVVMREREKRAAR